MIGVLYRPPNSKLHEFEDKLENLLGKITQEYKLFYVMGDFNTDMLKMNQTLSSNNFMRRLFSYALYPLI